MGGLEEAHPHLGQLGDEQGALAGVAVHAGGREVVPCVLLWGVSGDGCVGLWKDGKAYVHAYID